MDHTKKLTSCQWIQILIVDIENAKIDFEFKYERFIPLFDDDDLKD